VTTSFFPSAVAKSHGMRPSFGEASGNLLDRTCHEINVRSGCVTLASPGINLFFTLFGEGGLWSMRSWESGRPPGKRGWVRRARVAWTTKLILSRQGKHRVNRCRFDEVVSQDDKNEPTGFDLALERIPIVCDRNVHSIPLFYRVFLSIKWFQLIGKCSKANSDRLRSVYTLYPIVSSRFLVDQVTLPDRKKL